MPIKVTICKTFGSTIVLICCYALKLSPPSFLIALSMHDCDTFGVIAISTLLFMMKEIYKVYYDSHINNQVMLAGQNSESLPKAFVCT